MNLLKRLVKIGIIGCLLVILGIVGLYGYAKMTPKLSIKSANAIAMYDNENNLFFQGSGSKEWIPLSKISPNLINATISTEDKKFYQHHGFDFLRIIKALYVNIVSGSKKQGASTISQQYAKNPKDFVVLTLTSLIRMIIYYSTPFFIISFFNGGIEEDMFMNIFVMCNLVDMASSFFPLPGGTGMNELSFQSAFATIVGQGDILVWVLLGWRFFSYYVYLLMGIIILSYDVSYGNRKYRWSFSWTKLCRSEACLWWLSR